MAREVPRRKNSTRDIESSGRPSTSRNNLSVQKVEEAISVNNRLTYVTVVSHVTESIESHRREMSAERLGIHPPNRRFGDVKTLFTSLSGLVGECGLL